MMDADVFKAEIRAAKEVCAVYAGEKGLSEAAYIVTGGSFVSCGTSSVEIIMAALIKDVAELKAKLEGKV